MRAMADRLTRSIDSRGSQTPPKSDDETSERSYGRSPGSGMDTGVGSCHMASTFYEILRESGLQRQLENGWGRAYSDSIAADSASSPTSKSSRSHSRSNSRQSPKASSPPASRKHAQSRDGRSSKGPKSKKPRSGEIKEEEEEEDSMEAIQAMQEPGKSYSLKHGSQPTESGEDHGPSGYKLNREDYGGREYLSGLNTELDTLRKHLLQRANPPRSFP
ncbi:hypothetical protein TARUN_9611 [Trichoderma arundinaceum]|uniref:Uncharacterized protein n=1 Tax=Trichoderma arundinaceum TaxID=490622 RepID=A0A395N9T6_TRIAR|nr:hypothetical protein TARUN_9611 [Trichoderma arundinaceum]